MPLPPDYPPIVYVPCAEQVTDVADARVEYRITGVDELKDTGKAIGNLAGSMGGAIGGGAKKAWNAIF
ncbi:MAG: hypothetical protein FWD11_06940 [Micrococcales bacterium]|nr:hypothetical protein [Micrococcales bacterium]